MNRKGEYGKKVVVLVDSPQIRTEALEYSVELARRLKATLFLLVLLPFEMSGEPSTDVRSIFTLGERARNALNQYTRRIEQSGLPVDGAVRIGNPRSEWIKFAAESGPFETIIWGGWSDPRTKKHHWLDSVPDDLKSPIWVPSVRGNRKKTDRASAQPAP